MDIVVILFVYFLAFTLTCGEEHHDDCKSPQLLELGKVGTIYCSFQEGFFGVFWYNSSVVREKAIITLKDTSKDGDGYLSGEFDIHSDGSLIINNVSLRHEKVFSVVVFNSTLQNPAQSSVRVIVYVKSPNTFPLVNGCENERELCLLHKSPDDVMNCSVLHSRPAADLLWIVRTVTGDKNVSTDTNIYEDGSVYTVHAITKHQFDYTNLLALLVCKVEVHKEVLEQPDVQVLLLNSNANFSSSMPVKKYNFELGTAMNVNCGEEGTNSSYLVWMKNGPGETREYLLYAVLHENRLISKSSSGYALGNGGSLIVPEVEAKHEGVYHCTFGDGTTDGVSASYVNVYVHPVPRYLVVHGCESQQYCVLYKQQQDVITCSVYGILPEVELEWRIVHGKEFQNFFINQSFVVTKKESLFDITLTSEFHAFVSSEKMTIECRVSDPMATLFPLYSRFDLIVIGGEPSEVTPSQPQNMLLIVFLTGGVFLLLCLILLLIITKVRRRTASGTETDGDKELTEIGEDLSTGPSENLPPASERSKYIPEDLVGKLGNDIQIFQIWKEKFEDNKKRYVLEGTSCFATIGDKEDISIVILGKSGVGKSATANSILGEKRFAESMGTKSTTQESAHAIRFKENRCITVVDTPGLLDSAYPEESLLQEVSKIFKTCPNGIDVFVYVFNMGFIEFNEEDIKIFKSVEAAFGGKVRDHCALVCSHADSMETKMDLAQFLEEQKSSKSFSDFVDQFGNNIVAVNNRSTVPAERERNQNVLMAMADFIKTENKHTVKPVSNLHFKKLKKNQSGAHYHSLPTQESVSEEKQARQFIE